MKSNGLPAPSARERFIGESLVVAVILFWWLSSRRLPSFILPSPAAVSVRLAELFVLPSFLFDTLASMWRVMTSVLLALVAGSGIAFLAHNVKLLRPIVRQVITPFLSAFPSLAWAILAGLWFGPGNVSVLFVQTAILIPFSIVNMNAGLEEMDRELLEMGSAFTKNRWRRFRLIVVPLLLPYSLAALRISYGIGWKISLVSELLGADSGLGQVMLRAQTGADATTVLASCLAIVVMYLVGDTAVLKPLQRRYDCRRTDS